MRRRSKTGAGLAKETPADSSLPLLESASLQAGVPRALGLSEELQGDGFFAQTIVQQWSLVHEGLFTRVEESLLPLECAKNISQSPEPRLRFFAPGILARLLQDYPVEALAALKPLAADESMAVSEATQAFGVRPQAETMGPKIVEVLLSWANDAEPRVRRTAVEAIRPQGVWVKHLAWAVENPALLLPLLRALCCDVDRKVVNAVANCLNDISKKNPALVLEVLAQWELDYGDELPPRLFPKALRTLVKSGDPRAFRALRLDEVEVEATAKILGDAVARPNRNLNFLLQIKNPAEEAKMSLVYEIETPGKNPSRPRRRKCGAGTIFIPAKATTDFTLRERLFDTHAAPLIAGVCKAKFFLNGNLIAEVEFELKR